MQKLQQENNEKKLSGLQLGQTVFFKLQNSLEFYYSCFGGRTNKQSTNSQNPVVKRALKQLELLNAFQADLTAQAGKSEMVTLGTLIGELKSDVSFPNWARWPYKTRWRVKYNLRKKYSKGQLSLITVKKQHWLFRKENIDCRGSKNIVHFDLKIKQEPKTNHGNQEHKKEEQKGLQKETFQKGIEV